MTTEGALVGAASAVAVKAVDKAIDTVAERLPAKLGKLGAVIIDRFIVDFRVGFRSYLQISYEKCRLFKTLINPSVPLDVSSHYVSVKLKFGQNTCSDSLFMKQVRQGGRYIVSGLAGSGKSMFMKFMTIHLFETTQDQVPLFVELRKINKSDRAKLIDFIYDECSSGEQSLSKDQFERALSSGVFILILDGFDEVNEDKKSMVEADVLNIDALFPATTIIVSSRPDEGLNSWTRFSEYKVLPFEKSQTIKLLRKLPYDAGVRRRFIKSIENSLWDSHKSFLSTPLLATIMLLTYEEFAEIPDKIHAFYSQAFDTLCQKHDALKAQYTRETKTGFTREAFKACCAAFCVTSYLEEKFSFSPDTAVVYANAALKYIEQSSVVVPANVKGESVIHDLEKCICILQQDGTDLTFVHRSFQEYFAAHFASHYHDIRFKTLLDKFSRRYNDTAVQMTFDMARAKTESDWVLPTIDRYQKLISDNIDGGLHKLVATIYGGLELYRDKESVAMHPWFIQEQFSPLYVLSRLYPKELRTEIWFEPIRRLTYDIAAKLFLEGTPQNSPRVKSIGKFLSARGPSMILLRGIKKSDEWWLKRLGFEKAFRGALQGFDLIRTQREKREEVRINVINEFL